LEDGRGEDQSGEGRGGGGAGGSENGSYEGEDVCTVHLVSRTGHARVPERHVEEGVRLGQWGPDPASPSPPWEVASRAVAPAGGLAWLALAANGRVERNTEDVVSSKLTMYSGANRMAGIVLLAS
jgi:hypothetical protein